MCCDFDDAMPFVFECEGLSEDLCGVNYIDDLNPVFVLTCLQYE